MSLIYNLIQREGDYQVRPIEIRDIEAIRLWRNSQMNVLRQKSEISAEEQARYYKNVVFPQYEKHQPDQLIYSFLEEERLIGYGGLVNLSWLDSRAEMSFLVAPERASDKDIYQRDLIGFVAIAKKIAFEEAGFNRLFVETFSFRHHHLEILEACGFKYEGKLRQHSIFEGEYIDSLIHSVLRSEYENFQG